MSMLCSTHRRVHVCPIKALAAVSAEARALLPERFRSHFLGGGAPFTLGTEAPLYQSCLCRSGMRSVCSVRGPAHYAWHAVARRCERQPAFRRAAPGGGR